MAYTLQTAIEKAIDRCNLQGDGCNIYAIMYSYKAIRELADDEIERIYDIIAGALGFTH